MKRILASFLSLIIAISSQAQQAASGDTSDPGSMPPPVVTNSVPSVSLTITNGAEISLRTPTDWNATAVQVVSPFADDSGQTQYQTNSYNELSPGANFIADDGLLHASDPSFVLVSNEARAWTGQSQLTLAANANSPVLFRARLPDGQFVGTRMQGVFIFDSASGQTVQLASLRDSNGIQIETNKILYPDCFDGGGALSADLLFVNTLNGWSQDVVLKSFMVDDQWLAQAGLTNSEGLTAEIWTEFVEGATPRQTPVWVQGTMGDTPVAMADTQLDFGDFIRMDTGKAFVFGQPNQDVSLVAKQWIQTPDQRQFLVESVPLALLQTGMQAVPQSKPGKAQVQVRQRSGSRLEAMKALPRGGIRGEGKERREARIRPLKDAAKGLLAWLGQPALIWDYTTLNTGGVTNYSFLGDTTFYLPSSSAVTCYGTNTYVEGGCVIKLNTSASLSIKTPLSWNASMGRPVAICSSDDKSTGENIAGASGSPGTTLYGTAGLILDPSTNGAANASFNIGHLRVANMNTAIQFVSGGTNAHSLKHVQMVNCGVGVAPNGDSFSLLNALMANVTTGFGGSSTGAVADIEHLTYDGGTTFQATNILGTLGMTNSIVAGVGSVYVGTATNQVAILASNSGLFQSLSLGSTHYLVTNSPYRGIGTSSINPTLAGDLIDMVTTAPIELGTNYTVSSNAALTPQIPRDIGAQPDLGAHFYPLDYVVHGITVSGSSTLSLLNGVAVGFYGASSGISPGASAKVSSLGLPENLNRLTLVNTVFEQPQAWISNLTSFTLFNGYGVTARFTDISFQAAGTGARTLFVNNVTGSATVQDSSLRGVYWNAVSYSPGGGSITLKNSVLERCNVNWTQGNAGVQYYLNATWQNCLFNRCTLSLTYGSSTYGTWGVYDSLFDNCPSVSYSTIGSPFTGFGYNGWINTTRFLSGTGDKTGLVEDFIQGPLGNYYYPASGSTNSTATLIDADSTRTASGVGLAEYTTLLNQSKDTTNLDIGMHFAAMEAHLASAEFSAYQGTNNWYYARTTAPLGSTVVYFTTNGTPGSVGLTWSDQTLPWYDALDWIWNNGQFPGWDYDSLRIWQSPATAKLSVWSTATNMGYTLGGCSTADGAYAWIGRNGIGLTPWSFLATNATPVSINGRTYAQSGDAFSFQVNKGAANNYCDLIYWDPLIVVHRGASTLVSGLPDWFSDSNGDGTVNSSDGTGDWDGDGVTDRNDGSPFDPSNSAFQITIERPANGSTIN